MNSEFSHVFATRWAEIAMGTADVVGMSNNGCCGVVVTVVGIGSDGHRGRNDESCGHR